MEFRGLMGGFYRISEWIMRLSVINVLWGICSLPFVFFAATPFFSEQAFDVNFVRQWLVILAVVAPFTIVPASGAMFTVARKWVTGDPDVPLFKTFFRGYKENYKQSLFGALIFELFALILYVNYYFYAGQSGILKLIAFVFVMLLVLLAAAFLNYLSIMVHFHMKFWQIVKNAMLLTIGHPVNSITLLVANGAIIYFSGRFTFLIPFFVGSMVATVTFFLFHRSFERMKEKLTKKEEEAESGEPDANEKSTD